MTLSGRKRIAVGLSGGVDSSVAAVVLKEEGHEVLAVSMKIWDGRPLPGGGGRHGCYGPEEPDDLRDAEDVARKLGIPFHVVDLSAEFNARILEMVSREYQEGRTPNPCIHCNRWLKFDLLPAALRKEGLAFDAFATGHYVRTEYDGASGRHVLWKGIDRGKDQSYFLYQLTQEHLAAAVFPLGTRTKAEIRAKAAHLDLPVAEKAESQEFIAGGIAEIFGGVSRPGPIVNRSGEVLGEHAGIHLFTVGQRKGLGISGAEPLYVTKVDPKNQSVIVGTEKDLYSSELSASSVNWVSIGRPNGPLRAAARIRYRHPESPAVITPMENGSVHVKFDEPQRAVTPGQAVVFYDGDRVLGGGIID
ncbi:MAG: tRNA 2-thiouridine(34) synthase MnmA [Pseudomonadota bacterium]